MTPKVHVRQKHLAALFCYSGPWTPTKGHQGHRHSNTSPPVTMGSVVVSSGACVVGMDIPSPTSATPTRTSSLREAPNSRRELVFPNKEGVAQGGVVGGRAQGQGKPRRSNSLNYHSKESGLDQPTGGRVVQYTICSPIPTKGDCFAESAAGWGVFQIWTAVWGCGQLWPRC